MKTQNEIRSEFEKLEEISNSLRDGEIYWDDTEGCYIATDVEFYYDVGYANGALYAFQERQKKIDAVLRFLSGYDSIDIENSVNLRDCVNEIEELLK